MGEPGSWSRMEVLKGLGVNGSDGVRRLETSKVGAQAGGRLLGQGAKDRVNLAPSSRCRRGRLGLNPGSVVFLSGHNGRIMRS